MQYRIDGVSVPARTVCLRVDKGERVLETVQSLCEQLGIRGGTFTGIGACSEVDVRTWIPERADFTSHVYTGTIEMISLDGNISRDRDGGVRLHAHGSFSYLDEGGRLAVFAGHLADATIGYTGELAITTSSEPIDVTFDEHAGIDVWDLG